MNTPESALLEAGIDPARFDPSLIEKWQRLPTLDKPAHRNGAVLVKPDGAVVIRNWSADLTAVWQPEKGAKPFSPEAIAKRRAEAERAAQARREAQESAAVTARNLWDAAPPAGADHPYLVRKKLPPLGLREIPELNGWRGRWLITAMYSDPIERIRNLEGIAEDGTKRPVKDAMRTGIFGIAGPGMPTDRVVICEGWATAAALHLALEVPVIFATSASNLAAVAAIWRKGLPDARIIFAADCDQNEKGLTEARKAAQSVGNAEVVMPIFEGTATDWADLHTAYGVDAVRQAWGTP